MKDYKKFSKQILSNNIEDFLSKVNVEIEHSYYTHGNYDWIIFLRLKTIKNAKLFCELLNKTYQGYVQRYDLIKIMVLIRVQRIKNPKIKNLQQFIIDSFD